MDYVFNRLILLEDTSETAIFTMSRILNYLLGGSGISKTTDCLYEIEKLCENKVFEEERRNIYFSDRLDESSNNYYQHNITALHNFAGYKEFTLWKYKSKHTKIVKYLRPPIGYRNIV